MRTRVPERRHQELEEPEQVVVRQMLHCVRATRRLHLWHHGLAGRGSVLAAQAGVKQQPLRSGGTHGALRDPRWH